jgi:hypothetical protein
MLYSRELWYVDTKSIGKVTPIPSCFQTQCETNGKFGSSRLNLSQSNF